MLYLNLNPILAARGITNPYTFFVKHGISYGVANKLVYSTARSFRFDTIEKLCEILNCDVHDLLLWTPSAQQQGNPNHPLQVLRSTNDQTNKKKSRLKAGFFLLSIFFNLFFGSLVGEIPG